MNLSTTYRFNGAGWNDGAGRRIGTVRGWIDVGATAGTFAAQWAQNSSNNGTSTVLVNSYIKLTELTAR